MSILTSMSLLPTLSIHIFFTCHLLPFLQASLRRQQALQANNYRNTMSETSDPWTDTSAVLETDSWGGGTDPDASHSRGIMNGCDSDDDENIFVDRPSLYPNEGHDSDDGNHGDNKDVGNTLEILTLWAMMTVKIQTVYPVDISNGPKVMGTPSGPKTRHLSMYCHGPWNNTAPARVGIVTG